MRKTICICIISFLLSFVKAQETIPFRLTKHNNMIVKTLVNDKDSLDLMFQIAMEDASLSPERKRKADHIIFKNGMSDGNTIGIGEKRYRNIRFFDRELSGYESDGKIGTGIFKGKIFKVDYDKSQFVIYDKMPDLKGYHRMPVFYQNGQFFMVADMVIEDQQQEVYFLMQSGYSGGLLYSNEAAKENNMEKRLKITAEKTMKNSAGKKIVTKQGILPFLKVGDFVLKDVPAGFFPEN